jgi:hypothetical protein
MLSTLLRWVKLTQIKLVRTSKEIYKFSPSVNFSDFHSIRSKKSLTQLEHYQNIWIDAMHACCYLSVCLSICLSICLSQSVFLPILLPTFLSVSLPVFLCVHLPISLFVHLFIHPLTIYHFPFTIFHPCIKSLCPTVCSPISLFVCFSLHLYIRSFYICEQTERFWHGSNWEKDLKKVLEKFQIIPNRNYPINLIIINQLRYDINWVIRAMNCECFVCECVCVCVCMGVWEYGCMGVWVYGYIYIYI